MILLVSDNSWKCLQCDSEKIGMKNIFNKQPMYVSILIPVFKSYDIANNDYRVQSKSLFPILSSGLPRSYTRPGRTSQKNCTKWLGGIA